MIYLAIFGILFAILLGLTFPESIFGGGGSWSGTDAAATLILSFFVVFFVTVFVASLTKKRATMDYLFFHTFEYLFIGVVIAGIFYALAKATHTYQSVNQAMTHAFWFAVLCSMLNGIAVGVHNKKKYGRIQAPYNAQ